MNAASSKDELSRVERRRAKRARTFKSGKLLFGGFTQVVIDCLIVEMSETGARVETAAMTLIPDMLTLRMGDGTEHRARRAWATGNLIGLEFIP
jgi:hypothetical protein